MRCATASVYPHIVLSDHEVVQKKSLRPKCLNLKTMSSVRAGYAFFPIEVRVPKVYLWRCGDGTPPQSIGASLSIDSGQRGA